LAPFLQYNLRYQRFYEVKGMQIPMV